MSNAETSWYNESKNMKLQHQLQLQSDIMTGGTDAQINKLHPLCIVHFRGIPHLPPETKEIWHFLYPREEETQRQTC